MLLLVIQPPQLEAKVFFVNYHALVESSKPKILEEYDTNVESQHEATIGCMCQFNAQKFNHLSLIGGSVYN